MPFKVALTSSPKIAFAAADLMDCTVFCVKPTGKTSSVRASCIPSLSGAKRANEEVVMDATRGVRVDVLGEYIPRKVWRKVLVVEGERANEQEAGIIN